jgi:hypothetical protein
MAFFAGIERLMVAGPACSGILLMKFMIEGNPLHLAVFNSDKGSLWLITVRPPDIRKFPNRLVIPGMTFCTLKRSRLQPSIGIK